MGNYWSFDRLNKEKIHAPVGKLLSISGLALSAFLNGIVPLQATTLQPATMAPQCLPQKTFIEPIAVDLTGNKAALRDALTIIVDVRNVGSRYKRAQNLLIGTIKNARELGDVETQAQAWGITGLLQAKIGKENLAKIAYGESVKLARSIQRTDIEARSLVNWGNLFLIQLASGSGSLVGSIDAAPGTRGQKTVPAGVRDTDLTVAEQSAERYELAARAALESGESRLAVQALTYKARSYLTSGQATRAKEEIIRANAYIRNIPPVERLPTDVISLVDSLLDVAATLKQSQEQLLPLADKLLDDEAQTAIQQNDLRRQSLAEGFSAQIRDLRGDRSAALSSTERALRLSELAVAPDVTYRWYAQRAAYQKAAGDLSGAAFSYEKSVALLNRIRSALPQFDPITGQNVFRRSVGPIYLALAELYLENPTLRPSQADPDFSGLGRAQLMIETLKAAELDDFFRDDCVANALGRKTRLEEQLPKNAAVIYPIIFPDELRILISLKDGSFKVRKTAVSSSDLSKEANLFRAAIQTEKTRHDPSAYLPHARRLYDWIINPVKTELENIETIVFVPDGALRNIPMAALYDENQWKIPNTTIRIVSRDWSQCYYRPIE